MGVLPTRGDRRHPKNPVGGEKCLDSHALLRGREEYPLASPTRARGRAGDAAAPQIINNRSLVKLFCQIYTLCRRTERGAGAAAAPLDRSIHHGV